MRAFVLRGSTVRGVAGGMRGGREGKFDRGEAGRQVFALWGGYKMAARHRAICAAQGIERADRSVGPSYRSAMTSPGERGASALPRKCFSFRVTTKPAPIFSPAAT